MGGCGKPGHVGAGSDEGTQWCATCDLLAQHDSVFEKIAGWLRTTNIARPPGTKEALFALTHHIEGGAPPTHEQLVLLHAYIFALESVGWEQFEKLKQRQDSMRRPLLPTPPSKRRLTPK